MIQSRLFVLKCVAAILPTDEEGQKFKKYRGKPEDLTEACVLVAAMCVNLGVNIRVLLTG
jgi:hypothetical protein